VALKGTVAGRSAKKRLFVPQIGVLISRLLCFNAEEYSNV